MEKVLIKVVYDKIIEYYSNLDQARLLKDARCDPKDIWKNVEYVDRFEELSDEARDNWIDEIIYSEEPFIEYAYRKYDSLDEIENDLEKIGRYLRGYFSYLMENVLYVDLNRIKKGRSYQINKADQPIIQEILLRSVSQNCKDIIIGKWLKGQVFDDDHSSIVELSNRLFYLIENIDEADDATKNRWISTLKIALRSDRAHTMDEAEFLLRQIFDNALPFYHKAQDANIGEVENLDHEEIAKRLIIDLDDICKSVQETRILPIYYFLESVKEKDLLDPDQYPPLELLKMQSVCRALYQHVDSSRIDQLLTVCSSPRYSLEKKRQLYRFLCNIDAEGFDELMSIAGNPKLEITELRKICGMMGMIEMEDSTGRWLPNMTIADPYINHFLSIEWNYYMERKKRKETDHKRYKNKKHEKSKSK